MLVVAPSLTSASYPRFQASEFGLASHSTSPLVRTTARSRERGTLNAPKIAASLYDLSVVRLVTFLLWTWEMKTWRSYEAVPWKFAKRTDPNSM
jgi:hypothetical protein